jgi:hypothetical protein
MKHLSSLINPAFTQQTQQLARIDQLLKSVLPAAGHTHIQIANIADRELVVLTDSPAWSTRLRLYTQDMLYMLAQHTDYGITNIRIRLLRNHDKTKFSQATRQPTHISKNSAKIIRQAADTISDPDLKNSLLQLAKRQDSD